jgi:hypothetical protein
MVHRHDHEEGETMKRLIFPLVVLFTMAFACPLSSSSKPGAKVDQLLPDPQVGLEVLSDYHAELTVSFSGAVNGAHEESAYTYTQSEWPALGAYFTGMDAVDENGQPLYILLGEVGEAQYEQAGNDGVCGVRWGESSGDAASFLLASMLEPVAAASFAGEESVDGIAARHYTFDAASLELPEGVQASGEAWIASQGGYLVKYSLQVSGSADYFGEGIEGTQRYEYLLSEVEAHPQVVYPPGCEPVLTEVPAMPDASQVTRLPGTLDFATHASQEQVLTFYADYLEPDGWELASEERLEGQKAVLVYTRGDSPAVAMLVVVQDGELNWVTVHLFDGEPVASEPGNGTPQGPDTGANPALRVSSGLSILLGMDPSQPGLPSYHMEAFNLAPAWEGGAIVQVQDRMLADVQGADVHFVDSYTASGGSVTTSEAYLIAGEEYDVMNGVLQPPGAGLTKLAWVMWPLDPTVILGTGASSAQPAGSEVLDGRTAEVYDLDASGSMGAVAGVSLNVTAVSGRVWIDQETGALLKAELDYQTDVKDADGNLAGTGSGRLEMNVTQVGRVTVSLPGH